MRRASLLCAFYSLLLVLALAPTALSAATQLTASHLASIQYEIEKYILENTSSPPTTNAYNTCVSSMTSAKAPKGCCRLSISTPAMKIDHGRAEAVASMVRLAFHDAAPFNVLDGKGGPNGCIDFDDPDNAGLQTPVAAFKEMQATIKASYGIDVSLADLHQYAGLVATWCSLPALQIGSSSTIVNFPFKYGRKDAATCPYTADSGHLPVAQKSFTEVNDLASRWGMNMVDLAALMGAHQLGFTRKANSGFSTPDPLGNGATFGGGGIQGQWSANNAFFNAQQYYSILRLFIWRRQSSTTSTGGTVFSFVSESTVQTQTLMLNTDISIMYNAGDDETIISGTGTGNCSPAGNQGGSCPRLTASSCPVTGRCTVTPTRTALDGTLITNIGELTYMYGASTATNPSTVFQTASTIGLDTWFPDYISAITRLSELGYSGKLCTPGDTTCNPSSFVTSAPTKVPSKAPTKRPSKAPTKSPSKAPTKKPTKMPTKVPTKKPTSAPSKAPTKRPSKWPTKTPTQSPTKFGDTRRPSHAPSRAPTLAPTVSTPRPSSAPTREPSRAPTLGPTLSPTLPLTQPPTKTPDFTQKLSLYLRFVSSYPLVAADVAFDPKTDMCEIAGSVVCKVLVSSPLAPASCNWDGKLCVVSVPAGKQDGRRRRLAGEDDLVVLKEFELTFTSDEEMPTVTTDDVTDYVIASAEGEEFGEAFVEAAETFAPGVSFEEPKVEEGAAPVDVYAGTTLRDLVMQSAVLKLCLGVFVLALLLCLSSVLCRLCCGNNSGSAYNPEALRMSQLQERRSERDRRSEERHNARQLEFSTVNKYSSHKNMA